MFFFWLCVFTTWVLWQFTKYRINLVNQHCLGFSSSWGYLARLLAWMSKGVSWFFSDTGRYRLIFSLVTASDWSVSIVSGQRAQINIAGTELFFPYYVTGEHSGAHACQRLPPEMWLFRHVIILLARLRSSAIWDENRAKTSLRGPCCAFTQLSSPDLSVTAGQHRCQKLIEL